MTAGAFLAGRYPDAVSILWKGSAFKPWDGAFDFIPGLSDVDIHVYRPGGLDDAWELRRELFATAGPVPFRSPLQLMVMDPNRLPNDWSIVPGSFGVLHGGHPPIPPRTADDIAARDGVELTLAASWADQILEGVVGRDGEELWWYLRRSAWMFSNVLARAATVAGLEPLRVWRANRTTLFAMTDDVEDLALVRNAALEYSSAAVGAGTSWLADRLQPEETEQAVRAGHELLAAAARWMAARPGR